MSDGADDVGDRLAHAMVLGDTCLFWAMRAERHEEVEGDIDVVDKQSVVFQGGRHVDAEMSTEAYWVSYFKDLSQ